MASSPQETKLFTGLVEEIGIVSSISLDGEVAQLAVSSQIVAGDAGIGDSICINGCCLTMVSRSGESHHAHVMSFELVPETRVRTNLGNLKRGDLVNLERSLRADTRLGGHFVTGHIDGMAIIEQIEEHADWQKIWFRGEGKWISQLASKGSVAVDGISLTLVDVDNGLFSVALIPHTLSATNIGRRRAGDTVNIETDLLAKYVERQLAFSRTH